MFDVLHHARVQQLLQQADEARVLLEAGDDPAVREALTSVYADLGKEIHALARERTALAAELAPFDDEDDHTAIPGPEILIDQLVEGAPEEGPVDILGLTHLGHLLGGADLEPLDALLQVIVPPRDLSDPETMPEEVAKVQWASGELEGRLEGLPDALQTAVVGLLASRTRNMAAHLDVDIGPRRTLERLRRFREHQDLPWVGGLLPDARPERATWAADARAYWELLRTA